METSPKTPEINLPKTIEAIDKELQEHADSVMKYQKMIRDITTMPEAYINELQFKISKLQDKMRALQEQRVELVATQEGINMANNDIWAGRA